MDIELGMTYSMFISYFVGRATSTDLHEIHRIFGGELDDTKPLFRKIYINRLKGILQPPDGSGDKSTKEESHAEEYETCLDIKDKEECVGGGNKVLVTIFSLVCLLAYI